MEPHGRRSDFAARLRALREASDHSQVLFARKMGVGRQAQHLYETGARAPTVDYLLHLQDLGLDVASLFAPLARPRRKATHTNSRSLRVRIRTPGAATS